MRIPHTVPVDAFDAYRISEETLLLPNELHRTLRSENENWEKPGVPEELKIHALRVIAKNWLKNPVLEELPTTYDRDYLLEILPPDLNFEIAIKKIHYEYYWQRAAEFRWRVNDPTEHGDSWRRLYCERHLWDYLENLDATYFGALRQECLDLLDLVQEHVQVLRLTQLLPAKLLTIKKSEENDDDPPPIVIEDQKVHHMPMDLILPKLPNLREIYITIGVNFMKEDFDLDDFEFSIEDSLGIGVGAKGLEHLVRFSLTRSNLDQPRAAAILQGLVSNSNIKELDFSYCKLGDKGAMAIGAFLSERNIESQLSSLELCDNEIGPKGLSGLVRGIIVSAPNRLGIHRLNLRFNPIGNEGAGYLAALFLRFGTLEYLNISGCGIGPDGGMKLAEVLASGHTRFTNLQMNLTNNELGEVVGEAFESVTQSCVALTEVDVRICGFLKKSEFKIAENANRNQENLNVPKQSRHTNDYLDTIRSKTPHAVLQFDAFQFPEELSIHLRRDIDNEESENEESLHLSMENENDIL